MTKFNKEELFAILVIFLVLIGISAPNFIASLRRGRDQNRKDDLGALVKSVTAFADDFGSYPGSTPDGKILACKKPEDVVIVDKKGKLTVNLIPCEWTRDAIVDLTPGSSKVYIKILPGDPDFNKGVTYKYFSDGSRYQIFASLESKDDAEYDPKIVARNLYCGTRICNIGRVYGCPVEKTIETCSLEAKSKTQ